MEPNHRIAIKLAEAVSPDDVELAPIMIDSFLKGTKERHDLLSRGKENVLGSVGVPISASDLPLIFMAISALADIISIIFSPRVSALIKKYIFAPESENTSTKDNDFAKLIESFSKELATIGISKEKSEQIALRVIKILIAEPEGQRFVKSLGAVADEE